MKSIYSTPQAQLNYTHQFAQIALKVLPELHNRLLQCIIHPGFVEIKPVLCETYRMPPIH